MMNEPLKDVKTVKERLDRHYRFLVFDLSKARQLEEIDLEKLVGDYNKLEIVRADDEFDIVLNNKENDPINIQENQLFVMNNFLFHHLWITNSVSAGLCKIIIYSRLD